MKETLKNLLFITVPTLIIMFIILEVYVRSTYINSDMSDWASNDPFACFVAKPGDYSADKTVNEAGFISTPEIEVKKDPNTTRIVFLGGSSTAGTGKNLPDNETWPWKVVENLREETGEEIDFINGALGGYSTFESYGRLWSRLRFYEPDIIVVYHGWNDMYYFKEKYTENPTVWKRNFNVNARHYGHWIDKYIYWSKALRIIRMRLSAKFAGGGEVAPPKPLEKDFDRGGLEIFRGNVQLMREVAEISGSKIFMCKQASLIAPTTSEEDKARCRYSNHGFDHEAHIDAFNSIYNVLDEEFPNESVIDLSALSGTSAYFHDHIHQTTEGNAAIAEIIADSLVNNYFNPPVIESDSLAQN